MTTVYLPTAAGSTLWASPLSLGAPQQATVTIDGTPQTISNAAGGDLGGGNYLATQGLISSTSTAGTQAAITLAAGSGAPPPI